MNCDGVAELLPWLVNGTLDAGDLDAVRAHLAACADCRRDLGETRFAVAVHAEHLASDEIVDYAFERIAEGPARSFADRHLRVCSECTELVALARESHRLAEEPETNVIPMSRPSATRSAPRWLAAALAASLVLSFGLAAWLWVRWQEERSLVASTGARQRELNERIARLEGERRDLDAASERMRQLEAENQRLKETNAPPLPSPRFAPAPELNVPTFDLYPEELVRRGDPVANDLDVPAGSSTATFVLNSEAAPASGPLGLEIANERGRVIWRGSGLTRRAAGDFTVSVPTRLLPPGRYILTVYVGGGSARERIEHYRFRVSRASRRG
jgi:hypothetical protein